MIFVKCRRCGASTDLFSAEEKNWTKIHVALVNQPPKVAWVCPNHPNDAVELPANLVHANPEFSDQDPRGFTEPEYGSGERYERRRESVPWIQHTFWWLVHNAVAHPFIAVFPKDPAFRFHDWTSRKMHGK